jgi:hypothetical protein
MTVAEEEVIPALFDHAKRVYEEMLKRSVKEEDRGLEEPLAGPGVMLDVYTGHTTRLFNDLGIANPYYTKIMDALKGQGCIEQRRRGGGVAMSKWVLNYPPEEEGFRAIMDRKRGPKGKGAELEQRVKDLTKMVNDLYGTVENLNDAFQQLYDDIQQAKGK